jgi:hypothetical protein
VPAIAIAASQNAYSDPEQGLGSDKMANARALRDSAQFRTCLYASKDGVLAMAVCKLSRALARDNPIESEEWRAASVTRYQRMRQGLSPHSAQVGDE